LLPGWLTITHTHYAAKAVPLDFRTDPDGAGKAINQWVSDQTAGKIPAIVPDGALDPLVRVVLASAVYFDLPWDERLTRELTQDQPFHINATQIKTVPLMFKQHRLGYARKDGFQIAVLPYAGGTFQFVVILPDAVDGLPKVEKAITGELLSECARLQPTEVRLSFPRIHLEPPIVSLKRSLTAMGAGAMFDEPPGANFSRMVREGGYVSEVFHRTYLELDEEGTKAAAATATIIRPKNGVPHEVPHEVIKADHPFLFMIQHVPSGACLFLGRLTDPAVGTAAAVEIAPAKK
jgi:serpin B